MIDSANFSSAIQKMVQNDNLDIIDAICCFCEKNEMEVETAAKLLDKRLKKLLEVEAMKNKLIKRNKKFARLPF